jgi:RNA polymerase sigma-70 factor (ECF subfamily)
MHGTNESWLARLATTGSDQNEALAALRGLLMSRLQRTFHGRTGVDDALLEDVTQEALLKTLDSLDQFQGKSLFTTWATTIAIRIAFTELRRRRWKDISLEQLLEDAPGGAGQVVDTNLGPQTTSQQTAMLDDMYRIIHTELTDKQRDGLLAELKGMPLEEIGRRMGSSRNATYKLTHDARKRLKQHLESAGYTVADLQIS